MSQESAKPVPALIALNRLYCGRARFEHALVPVDHRAPPPDEEIEIGIALAYRLDKDDESQLHVQLIVQIEPDGDKNQPYRVEVAYVGEFSLSKGLWDLEKEGLAKVNCAAILLPYVRQTVHDLTSRGTNGPILMQPINVAAMLENVSVQEAGDPEGAP